MKAARRAGTERLKLGCVINSEYRRVSPGEKKDEGDGHGKVGSAVPEENSHLQSHIEQPGVAVDTMQFQCGAATHCERRVECSEREDRKFRSAPVGLAGCNGRHRQDPPRSHEATADCGLNKLCGLLAKDAQQQQQVRKHAADPPFAPLNLVREPSHLTTVPFRTRDAVSASLYAFSCLMDFCWLTARRGMPRSLTTDVGESVQRA